MAVRLSAFGNWDSRLGPTDRNGNMDIIILPTYQGTPTYPGLFSSEGLNRLTNLLGWLSDGKTTFDLYVMVPAGSDGLLEPLIVIAQLLKPAVTGTLHLLIDAEHVTDAALEAIAANGLSSLIVSVGPLRTSDGVVQQVIARHFAFRPGSALNISMWLEPGADYRNLSRARAFQSIGIPPEKITSPMLPLYHISALGPPESAAIPSELHSEAMMCDLYGNTLTVDADGNVRACTRYQRSGVIGNLMQHSPEALIIRKGQMLGQITSSSVCLTCGTRGRFLWPERKSVKVAGHFRDGLELSGEQPYG